MLNLNTYQRGLFYGKKINFNDLKASESRPKVWQQDRGLSEYIFNAINHFHISRENFVFKIVPAF